MSCIQKGDTVVFNIILTVHSHALYICGRDISFSAGAMLPTLASNKEALSSCIHPLKRTERVITAMQPDIFQAVEGGMKTQKFLQGQRRKTILGELHNKVSGREIERTFQFKTERDSFSIAKAIYDQLKEAPRKETFSLLRVGIIRSIIMQTQYNLDTHEHTFSKRKITVNLYEKGPAAVKIKSPPVRKYKKVKVKEEKKFCVPYIDGKNLEMGIQEIFQENVSKPLKEGNSWKKEKYQIFIHLNNNIFTIAISQIFMLQNKDNGIDVQSNVPLKRIEIEYQGTQWIGLSENVQVKEREQPEQQNITEIDAKVEKEIIKQIRQISQRVLEICENELCLPLSTM